MNLKAQLEENSYVVIDFISEDKAKELYEIIKKDTHNYVREVHTNISYGINDEKNALGMLIEKIPLVSETIGELVLPTYSFSRLYKYGAKLDKHIDKPSCEISVTVHIGDDGNEWALGIKNPKGEDNLVYLKPGQAMIYLGCKALHWREDLYTGNDYAQIFLHYVKHKGTNWQQFFDRFRNRPESLVFDLGYGSTKN